MLTQWLRYVRKDGRNLNIYCVSLEQNLCSSGELKAVDKLCCCSKIVRILEIANRCRSYGCESLRLKMVHDHLDLPTYIGRGQM